MCWSQVCERQQIEIAQSIQSIMNAEITNSPAPPTWQNIEHKVDLLMKYLVGTV